jgi:hypothetical protein
MTQFSSLYGTYLDEELGTDDSTVLFTTVRRKSAINKGVREFAKLTKCLKRESTITITGGTAEYNLNSTAILADGDFMEFDVRQVQFVYTDASSNVTILEGDDLPRRDVEWLNRYWPAWQQSTVASSVMQLPEAYYEREQDGARYLGFTPVPSTGSSASAKVICPYVAYPVPITSDTAEPYTVAGGVRFDLRPYHQAPVHFAAYQLEKLRRDDQASQSQFQKFMGYVAQYFQDKLRKRGGTQATFVKNYLNRRGLRGGDRVDPRTGV